MKRPDYLYVLCSGEGLGSATRQLAIIQEISAIKPELPIKIFTSGIAFDFFRGQKLPAKCQLVELAHRSFLENYWTVIQHRKNDQPCLIVFDSSNYYPFFLGVDITRITVSQLPDIKIRSSGFALWDLWRKGFLFSFLLTRLSLEIQKAFSHFLIVPVLIEKTELSEDTKVRQVPLIVRKGFADRSYPQDRRTGKPLLLLGGGTFGSPLLRAYAEREGAEVLKRQENTLQRLQNSNPILTQGGLSSLSECLALGKTLLIWPIPRHWEQNLNTLELTSLGFATLLKPGKSLESQIPPHVALAPIHRFVGAETAARLIVSGLK